MNSYIDYSPSDIITILIFGGLFFLLAYGSAFAVYIGGMKEVKQHQTTLSSVIVKAIMIQLLATLFVFVIVGVLDLQSKIGGMSNVKFSEATATFFVIDWANIDIAELVRVYEDDDKKTEELGIFLVIKALWSILSVVIVFVPIVVVYLILHSIMIKHKENKGGGLFEVATDFFTAMIFAFILFTIHLTIPFIILNNMYIMHKDEIVKKANKIKLINNRRGRTNKLIGLDYSDRASSFINHSLDIVINKKKKN